MHVFIAGASGAVGRHLIPLLTSNGHTVTGTTRTAAKADALRALGAEPVVLDGLDRAAVLAAVAAARPDAIVNEMTSLATALSETRHVERAFAQTNRLRSEGTDHLLEAARASGVPRVVAQSFTSWPYARVGGPVKTEEDPLDAEPPAQLRTTLAAIRQLEEHVTAAGGVVLRYGGFYGPGTGAAPGGDQWEAVRARKFPLVGDGGGIWSFCQIEDAASATLAALERWTPGQLYNVCDDDPAPVREWLPAIARAAGGKPPRRVPRWLGRLAAGEHGVTMMCEIR
ncbi:MAG TPA: NAD(P)-dependent oxidoreductase, partial [Conexibacter sp.]|nr:NAD(P)-dependent oxidoreductase [Conexibacter sp.]